MRPPLGLLMWKPRGWSAAIPLPSLSLCEHQIAETSAVLGREARVWDLRHPSKTVKKIIGFCPGDEVLKRESGIKWDCVVNWDPLAQMKLLEPQLRNTAFALGSIWLKTTLITRGLVTLVTMWQNALGDRFREEKFVSVKISAHSDGDRKSGTERAIPNIWGSSGGGVERLCLNLGVLSFPT